MIKKGLENSVDNIKNNKEKFVKVNKVKEKHEKPARVKKVKERPLKVKRTRYEPELLTIEEGKLIVTIVNRGFAENVIFYARKVGATGATILNGRGASKNPEKFMGMNVTPEREIVLIVISAELADEVVNVISEHNGATSPAGGVCFCLPLSHISKLKR